MRSTRSGRLAQMGALAGAQAARHTATRTANLTRSQARAEAALLARQEEMVERLVIVLGSMKGAAVKVGQLLSVVDSGLVPPSQRESFQRKLAELQANLPRVPWRHMQQHVVAELGSPLDEAFAEFDRHPVAAASIGQVYRARTYDGRDVAVKVQYPGIEAAVRADLRNVKMFLTIYSRLLYDGFDGRALAAELEERILEELDYVNEARNTKAFAAAYDGHPFIVIPDVVEELSTGRVLVTSWMDGVPLQSSYDESLAERNRQAEIIFRFFHGSAATLSMSNSDPHPGNILVTPSGALAFLDFGQVRRPTAWQAESHARSMRAVVEGDAATVKSLLEEGGFLVAADAINESQAMAGMLNLLHWYLQDETLDFSPGMVNRIAASYVDASTELGRLTRQQNLPAQEAFWIRSELQVAGILGQLRPTINLHRVAREWLYGEEPVTELGRQQAAWHQERLG